MDKTLYRRPLPADAIAFSSPEGRQVFAEALASGGLDGYFPLAEQFHTQSDPAFCGLGSLVVALNALGIDPGRLWKGPWRWFAEDLLDCCVPLAEVKERGLDLVELSCLARCNGAEVNLHHADADVAGAWYAAVADAAKGETVLIAAYDRASMGQTGAGHFSPIGGYHAARDLVLVLDVARFKYPPHWVSAERLWRSMHLADPVTGRARGWMSLRRRSRGIALGFCVRCDGESWQGVAQRLATLVSELASAGDFAALCRALLPFTSHLELRTPHAAAHQEALATARAGLRSVAAFPLVADVVGADRAEGVTILLLAIADRLPPMQRSMLGASESALPDDGPIAAELSNVRAQLAALWGHRC